jgi:uncharacterized membrane protein YoaK (UPF0700 family)
MWLLQAVGRRQPRDDLFLGGSTALVAGLVNVCSVMTFFTFSSNVTGHAATFVEEVVKGHWYQVGVVLAWLLLFLAGAFVANLCITLLSPQRSYLGHALPLLVQAAVLFAVAYYGHRHYDETLWETELLVAVLLFTMGIQNGTVSTVSGSVVRTTHLTGLFTDLAMELSMILQRRFRADPKLRFKLLLHLVILAGYMVGGIVGGFTCMLIGFRTFYLASVLLVLVVLHDVLVLRWPGMLKLAAEPTRSSRESQGM